MTDERLNELLSQLDNELTEANRQLSIIINEGMEEQDAGNKIDYWINEVARITSEMQSLLQSL